MAKSEKATHEEVDYGPSTGEHFCYICSHYIDKKPPACTKTQSPILPAFWCRLYEERPERKPDSY